MRILSLSLALFAVACSGGEENPVSKTVDPNVELTPTPPAVITGWPCPPFADVVTTEDKVDDNDGDSLTDCQEEVVGSNPDDADSDGDGVGDFFEIGEVADALDTNFDGIPDIIDTDDDGDGEPTNSEVESPGDDPRAYDFPDLDGVPNYLDDDEDNDRLFGDEEGDLDGSGEDPGDRNGDNDGDDILNWADNDDDNDGACCGDEDSNGNLVAFDDDTDGNGTPDWADTDDDGDGILTADEDRNEDGNPMNDNFDGDGYSDYQDIDEDGDTLDWRIEDLDENGNPNNEDTDGDGLPNYRDNDDDGDTVFTFQEDEEDLLPQTTTEPEGLGDLLDDDTDGDGIINYLDNDDDNDGCLTKDEDLNTTGSAVDDDTNENDIPDFLEADVAECENPTVTFRLDLDGANFDAFDGEDLIAVVRDGSTVVSTEPGAVDAGTFSLTFPDALDAAITYSVDLFIDLDDNGSCDNGTETSFRITGITSDGTDQTATIDGIADELPAACSTFP